MIVYPSENFDSWVSENDAEIYFETRLKAQKWDSVDKEAALITAFRSIGELNLDIDLTDSVHLIALQTAQMEQCLYEIRNDLESDRVQGINLGGMLNVKFAAVAKSPRFSCRTLGILRPYLIGRSISRTR